MKILRSSLNALRRARRPYLILNLAYYGLIIWTMVYVVYNRSIQETLQSLIVAALGEGPLAPILEALTANQVLLAIGMIFAVNLVAATFLAITLPSLIVPFSGLLLLAVRALTWGALFAPQIGGPVETRAVWTGIGLAVLILLEGQGYVLAGTAAFVQGRALFWPSSVDASGPGRGYAAGLKEQARLYVLIMLVLLVAAVYEVGIAVAALP
jgi:hypothetical protein